MSQLRRFRQAWCRLRWRLAALTVALLTASLGVVGAIQYALLRQYLVGQTAQSAALEAAIAGKTWLADPQRPVRDPGGSMFRIYDVQGGSAVLSPAPASWVEPSPAALAGVAAAPSMRGPGPDSPAERKRLAGQLYALPRQPPSQPAAQLLQAAGLGPLHGLGSNQRVLSGSNGDVVLTGVALRGSQLLVMETSLSSADAALRADLVIFFLAGALTLLAAAALAIWLTSRTLDPLARVSAVASEITAGAYERRAGLHGEDEVGRLATAFDQMVDRLQEQVLRAREADARTRRFLADASHELRTPMAALLGNMEVLRMGVEMLDGAESPRPDGLKRSAALTHAAAQRMSKLLRDLLEITRLDQPEFALRMEPVEVVGLLVQAARTAAHSTLQHAVQIDAVDAPLIVLGDHEALERIVVNLLDNSARYSPDDASIGLGARKIPGGQVEISVTDHGPGIARGEQERIFERLYRGEHARETPGSGLGLAISRALARRHGGDLTVQSEPGQGSVFLLRLPSDGY